jgi:hypothetical protein
MMSNQAEKLPYQVDEVEEEVAFDFIEKNAVDLSHTISNGVVLSHEAVTDELFSQEHTSPLNDTKLSPVVSRDGQPKSPRLNIVDISAFSAAVA